MTNTIFLVMALITAQQKYLKKTTTETPNSQTLHIRLQKEGKIKSTKKKKNSSNLPIVVVIVEQKNIAFQNVHTFVSVSGETPMV